MAQQDNLVLRSSYVTMRDGVRLAVSVWLPEESEAGMPRSAVMASTRYWRAMALKDDKPENQSSFLFASHLWSCGYVLVVCDVRGTGASFGHREMELPSDEVADLGELIEWVAAQPWCDGQVATTGTSYTANTTLMSCATSPPPLKVGVARAMDFDVYRQLICPGGILNTWMADTWGEMTGAMDRNDAAVVMADETDEVKEMVIGVRPVDDDTQGAMLAEAVSGHRDNFNAKEVRDFLEFIDDTRQGHPGVGLESFAIYHHQDAIEAKATPIVYRAGWFDAGVSAGAMSFFTSFSNPRRVIVGPWNHGGDFRADPFQPGDGIHPEVIPAEQVFNQVVGSIDAFLKPGAEPLEMNVLEYYTLGENRWKSTHVWPLPETRMERMYLSADKTLRPDAPTDTSGCDVYRVDPTAGTGQCNRWHTQVGGGPVHHPDRREADRKLLVYDSQPLEAAVEITGHPLIHLNVRSTAPDGQFFAYLEAVLPDGQVKLVTEGQLRAVHRKVSDDPPPYTMFGPYHTCKREDAIPLVPGELAQVAFDLFPISIRFEAGWRIRLAIAGADRDVFDPISGCEAPEITLERNARYSSFIDLPTIPTEDQGVINA